MSLGKKLFGMFVEVEETETGTPAPAAAPAAATARTPASGATAPKPASPPPPPRPSPENADANLLAQLRKVLQDNNRPGFDYLEFQASLQALSTVIPDESTRYRSAFATAATIGVTVPTLLESAQWYRELLKKEAAEFDKEYGLKQKSEVGNKQTEIDALQKSIKTSAETIERLTREITEAQARAQAMEAQLSEATGKLERARNRFQASVQTLDSEIAGHQTLIRTLLGTGA